MEIDVNNGKVRVNISADLTADEVRELLRKLGNAHGKLTGICAPDSGLGRFWSEDIDIRPVGEIVQISLLSPCGWVQHGLTHAQIPLLVEQIQIATVGAPPGTAAS